MYQYNNLDKTLVKERVAQFRGQVQRRLSGELSEDQFKPLRLTNGVYLQLHAYMLRVAIPYGTLSSRQIHALAKIARKYDKGFGHFTTRQNIQFNWIKLKDVPDILEDLSEVEMHALQTSGDCIRNVSADQFAGATPDEVEDPRILGEIIRQWSTLHPEFSFLPRKFKFAINGAKEDRAAIKVHDIGIQLKAGPKGPLAQILVGGGLGRTPVIAKEIHPGIEYENLLPYLEAILRVYNTYGRRDNKYKARIKILVNALGIDAFREKVEAQYEVIKVKRHLTLTTEKIDSIREHFQPPPFAPKSEQSLVLQSAMNQNSRLARFFKNNCDVHRAPGYSIVSLSMKPIEGIPGDISAQQLDTLADLASRFSHSEARITHTQNVVLPHVLSDDLPALFEELEKAGFATPNRGLASDTIACPGLDYCALANARSIPIAQAISRRLASFDYQEQLGPVSIKISGCINACAHHHVGNIGILGIEKGGREYYQIMLGGSAENDASLGTILGSALEEEQAVDAVETILNLYLEERLDDENFIEHLRRVGSAAFKEAVYGDA